MGCASRRRPLARRWRSMLSMPSMLAKRPALLMAVAALALVARTRPLAAQAGQCAAGLAELRALEFSGNRALTDATLTNAIESVPSSGLRRRSRWFGERRCLAPGALLRDLARLMLLYRRSGYPAVRVDTVVQHPDSASRVVRFVITEGPPIRVDSVALVGVTGDTLRRRLMKHVTLRPG